MFPECYFPLKMCLKVQLGGKKKKSIMFSAKIAQLIMTKQNKE